MGWFIDPSTGLHHPLVEQGVSGSWSLVSAPGPGTGDVGFGGVAAIPGGGLWAVGVTSNKGNFSTLIEHHC